MPAGTEAGGGGVSSCSVVAPPPTLLFSNSSEAGALRMISSFCPCGPGAGGSASPHQDALQPLIRLQCLKENILDHTGAGFTITWLPGTWARQQLLSCPTLNHQQVRSLGGHSSPTRIGQLACHWLQLHRGHLLGRLELDSGHFRCWPEGLELDPTHFLGPCLPTPNILQNYEALPSRSGPGPCRAWQPDYARPLRCFPHSPWALPCTAAPTTSTGRGQQDELSGSGRRWGRRGLDAAGDELEALGSLHQEKRLGVGDPEAWGRNLGRAPCHLQGECGLDVGEDMDILGDRRSRGSGQRGRGLGASGRSPGGGSRAGRGVRPQVPLQVGGHDEAAAADRAGKGALRRVGALVQQQVGRVREGLGTERAAEGPLAGVHTLVLPQVGALCEALAADAAGVGSLARVHVPVAPQAGRVLKGLGAVRARVGPLARVLPQVVLVVRRPLEGQAALAAGEGPQARVHAAVDLQQRRTLEGLGAVGALVGPLACVAPLVVQQGGGALEGLGAVGALVGPLPRVRALVVQEPGGPPERLATLPTLVLGRRGGGHGAWFLR
ncbi:hypothetical protein MC885_011817 [Smutsia gigantea]|nr:hypothetical protein MC885_011817 [Smutsia gigantea]